MTPSRQASIGGLFSQVMMNYLNVSRRPEEKPHQCEPIELKAKFAKHDLKLTIDDDGSGFDISILHSERLDSGTVRQMLEDIVQLIAVFSDHPRTPLESVQFTNEGLTVEAS
jgi:signal transduction histidine kinase